MMQDKKQNVLCVFGRHKYTITDKEFPAIIMCQCGRASRLKCDTTGYTAWWEYNEREQIKHFTSNRGR